MLFNMERITTTIDAETLREIRKLAGKRGVSRFLQEAAKERLARIRILALLDELDIKHGEPSPALEAEIDADMRDIFGFPPAASDVQPDGVRSRKRSAPPHRGASKRKTGR